MIAGDVDQDGDLEWMISTPGAGDVAAMVVDGGEPWIDDPEWLVEDPAEPLRGGELLFSIAPPDRSVRLGEYAAAPGDLNGDGVPDLVLGHSGVGGGFVAFSGQDGSVLEEWHVPNRAAFLSRGLVGLSDVNGDGVPELLVTVRRPRGEEGPELSPSCRHDGHVPGTVLLLCGRTRAELWRYQGPFPDQSARRKCIALPLGDVDGDGTADFVIASYDWDRPLDLPGHLAWISGRTHEVLRWINMHQFSAW